MSLLGDLQNIDLSGIVNARASITVTIDGGEIQALLEGGAAQTILGELGSTLDTLRSSLDNPTALIKPLLDAIADLPLDVGDLPLAEYLDAVREGAEILIDLLKDFDGNPASLGRIFGTSLSDILDNAQSSMNDIAKVDLGELGQLRAFIDRVESGGAINIDAFVDLALDLLLPFPDVKAGLRDIRVRIDGLLEGALAISLPSTRSLQLVIALDAVANAAISGDVAGVQLALNNLNSVRLSTQTALQADLLQAVGLIDNLHIDSVLQVIVDLNSKIHLTGDTILDFMENMRLDLANLRARINETLDPQEIIVFLTGLVDLGEESMRIHIADEIDLQVERAKEWLRDLLRHLPLRQLRAVISNFINKIAQAIVEADLGQYARQAQELLQDLNGKISSVDLGEQIRDSLQSVQEVIDNTLSTITDGLDTITQEINDLATQAQEILQRVVDAIHQFQDVINNLVDAVDNLGIDEAAQQVIDTLAALRETAEELLSSAPLPEPMRPLVQQVIDAVKGVDIDAAFDPIREVVNELKIPDNVEGTIRAALEKAQDCLNNLIPTQLIESLEAELTGLLDVIRDFNPASLLGEVTGFIDDAANFIEGLDPRPHIAPIREPFVIALDLIDKAHPNRLLAPVIQAYNDLFNKLSIATPEDASRHIGGAISTVGENVGRSFVEPTRQLVPANVGEAGADAGGYDPASEPISDIRPGDVLRMFGYLPSKLREFIGELDGVAALAILDQLIGGLAINLRRIPEVIYSIDERLDSQLDALLIPLGEAQVRAQLALQAQANLSLSGADGAFSASFDFNGAFTAIASASPGSMRLALENPINIVRERTGQISDKTGGNKGVQIERIATLLEQSRLSSLLGNIDDFLAALDPEPLALELDAFTNDIIRKVPEIMGEIGDDLQALLDRATAIFERYNPGSQAIKFLSVLDVLREELDVMNPARLAAELAEIHAAIRETLAAYDPAIFAEELFVILQSIANELRALDPVAMLGDLSLFDGIADRVEAALPTSALQDVGAALAEIGDELVALDPGALLDALENIAPRVLEAIQRVLEAIKAELIALLESLQYFSASVSVEIEVEASLG